MPRKIRQLIADLRKNGFYLAAGRGKGSHRMYIDPETDVLAEICGHDGDDAQNYLEKHVKQKIAEAKQKRGEA